MIGKVLCHDSPRFVLASLGCSIGAISSASCLYGANDNEKNIIYNTDNFTENKTERDLSFFSPYSPVRIFRPNAHLEIAYDVRTRNPIYVMERLKWDPNAEKNHKRHNFYEEQRLPEAYRSRNSSYHLSGYDRGHLAPSADFIGEKERLDTFNLINVSPQHHELNRKLWAQLESWTRQVARSTAASATTYVVTGPLWLPSRQVQDKCFEYQYPAIGSPPNMVSVPTHFFKLVAVIQNDRIVQYACFVMSNDSDGSSSRALSDCLVRWTDLEKVTGLEFFPMLVTSEWKEAADLVAVIRGHQSVQLTTAESETTSKSNRKKVVTHLCPGGVCQRSNK
jgi:DNA/RNA endonuclease G (NUC1)